MHKVRSILLSVLLVALAPFAAHAQAPGQITALVVTPSPAQANETVSISVAWVGNCSGEAILDFGDGSPTTVFAIPSLGPVTHTYIQTETLKVSAGPTAACGGQAIATLPVINSTGILRVLYCRFFGCNPTISSMPSSNVTPGGQVNIQGSGFGNQPGTLQIVLQSFYNQLIYDVPVAASDWSDDLVTATIPSGIESVTPQLASFQIITNTSSASNAYFQAFNPTLDLIEAPASQINCTMTKHSPSDMCQDTGSTNWPAECAGLPPLGMASAAEGYSAYHGSGWQLFGASDSGTDSFSISLQNGWVNAGGATFSSGSSDSSSYANLVAPISNQPIPSWSWQVSWNVDACGVVGYVGAIYIMGPAGVPY
jgi:hypothetical protein